MRSKTLINLARITFLNSSKRNLEVRIDFRRLNGNYIAESITIDRGIKFEINRHTLSGINPSSDQASLCGENCTTRFVSRVTHFYGILVCCFEKRKNRSTVAFSSNTGINSTENIMINALQASKYDFLQCLSTHGPYAALSFACNQVPLFPSSK